MIRSMRSLVVLLTLGVALGCSKPGDSQPAGTAAAPAASTRAQHASFESGGAAACDKYLPADVVKKILGTDVDERKKLSAQSCTVRNTVSGGDITITLKSISPGSFHAFRDYLSSPEPLAGVGDSALTSIAPTVTAIKGTMGCDFDASRGSNPAALAGTARAKVLGDICNHIFADAK